MDPEDPKRSLLAEFLRAGADAVVGGQSLRDQPAWCEPFRDSGLPLTRLVAAIEHSLDSSGTDAEGDPLAGDEIGGFVLEQRLRSSARSVLYSARNRGRDAVVALELYRALDDEGEAAAFTARVARFTTAAHRSLATVEAHGLLGRRPWVAMTAPDGSLLVDLFERFERGPDAPLPASDLADFASFFEAVARGLHSLHETGLVHGELSAEAVVVREDGFPCLLFPGPERRAGGIVELHSAPECVRGRRDAQSDLWSLGILAFRMLAGRPPFDAGTEAALRTAILRAAVPDLLRERPEIGRDLATIVASCLVRSPSGRYATAARLADDLARVRSGQAILARPPSLRVRIQGFARRHAIVTLLLALCGGGTLWLAARDAAHLRREARTNLLADAGIIDRLLAESEAIAWCGGSTPAPDLGRWRARADEVLERRAVHAEIVRSLAAEDDPESPRSPRDASQGPPELRRRHAEAARELATVAAARRSGLDPASRARLDARAARASRTVNEIESDPRWPIARGSDWSGPSEHFRRQHEQIVRDLDRLALRRAEVSERSRRQLLSDLSDPAVNSAWTATLAGLHDDPRYTGRIGSPIAGLVPLGRDPASRLWSFWHPASGERPADRAAAEPAANEQEGVVFILVPGGAATLPEGSTEMLPPFLVSARPLSVAQWTHALPLSALLTGQPEKGAPARGMSFDDAAEVARRFGARLPTVAETLFLSSEAGNALLTKAGSPREGGAAGVLFWCSEATGAPTDGAPILDAPRTAAGRTGEGTAGRPRVERLPPGTRDALIGLRLAIGL